MSDSDGYPVGTMVVWGVEYAVWFSQRRFRATVGGHGVSTYTWDELDAAIKKAARRARVQVDVPFRTVEGRVGQAVSLHATNRLAVQVIWSDGSRDTITLQAPYQVEAPVQQLRELEAEKRAVIKRIDRFNRDWRLRDRDDHQGTPLTLDQAVRQAVEAKAHEEES